MTPILFPNMEVYLVKKYMSVRLAALESVNIYTNYSYYWDDEWIDMECKGQLIPELYTNYIQN